METENEQFKWKVNLCFSGKIRLLTGLHIGAGGEALKIGGVDSPVITIPYRSKNGTVKDLPYIPGSSLKGKLRKMAMALSAGNGDVETLFGSGIDKRGPYRGPTRIIIRDSLPTSEWIEKITESNFYDGGLELKGENWIKYDGTAKPRFIQRVIPGVEFDVNIILSLYDQDDEKKFIDILKASVAALEDSYLGGNGTRGYGRIDFDMDFDNPVRRDIKFYLGNE